MKTTKQNEKRLRDGFSILGAIFVGGCSRFTFAAAFFLNSGGITFRTVDVSRRSQILLNCGYGKRKVKLQSWSLTMRNTTTTFDDPSLMERDVIQSEKLSFREKLSTPSSFSLTTKLGVQDSLFTFQQSLSSHASSQRRSEANYLHSDFPATALPKIIGHRGAVFAAPENTLASFKAAARMGCDGVEIDVFRLKCGSLVVFHGDGTDEDPGYLYNYCGVEGNILDLTYVEMKNELNLSPFSKAFPCPVPSFKDNHVFIPTLQEALVYIKRLKLNVKIELKGQGTAEPCLKLVEDLGMVQQCSFSSFAHDRIQTIRKLRPQQNADGSFLYKTGALFKDDPPYDFALESMKVGASEVHLKYDTCTVDRICEIHDTGMNSMAWFRGYEGMIEDSNTKYLDVGNEDESMYHIVRQTGVKAMCVNRPDVLAKLFSPASLQDIF